MILKSVVCSGCGPRYWNTFDGDPLQRPFFFPFICRAEFVRQGGPCATCGGQVLYETAAMPEQWAYFDNGDRVVFPDGDDIPVYELASEVPR